MFTKLRSSAGGLAGKTDLIGDDEMKGKWKLAKAAME